MCTIRNAVQWRRWRWWWWWCTHKFRKFKCKQHKLCTQHSDAVYHLNNNLLKWIHRDLAISQSNQIQNDAINLHKKLYPFKLAACMPSQWRHIWCCIHDSTAMKWVHIKFNSSSSVVFLFLFYCTKKKVISTRHKINRPSNSYHLDRWQLEHENT